MASHPPVDLVLVFSSAYPTLSKQESIREAQQAQDEYNNLLTVLRDNGFLATGRRGGSQGEILILVHAPWETIESLARSERHSDFIFGLPTASVPTHPRDFQSQPLTPAERLRLVNSYISAITVEGGLGIVPGAHNYPRLKSIVALHDQEFNDRWIRGWTRSQIGFGIQYKELVKIKDQFGEAVALYFAFLSFYTKSLIYPAVVGVGSFFMGRRFDPLYSLFVILWSIVFVEWWRLQELILSVRWGCLGAVKVEKRRPQFRGDQKTSNDAEETFPWWKREIRILASLPIVLSYATALVFLLTFIFVFEAFVTQLYTGPGHRLVSFSPTVLFAALIPRLLSLYQDSSIKLTDWENHSRQSDYNYSLTIKTFVLSALVAYLGLALSAFVYIPFHEQVMTAVHSAVFATKDYHKTDGLMEASLLKACSKVNPNRLREQIFAFTVTNQIINFFVEVVLPVVLRKAQDVKTNGFHGKRKRVGFDDQSEGRKEEREFLDNVRHQAALPDYTLFGDYNEMATQFGYVAMWSTIWPLAPLMAFLNNWFEARGDAFKIVRSCRRPLPSRVETIGPWLELLGFISWMAALTNSALVYMFEPRLARLPVLGVPIDATTTRGEGPGTFDYSVILFPAMLIALSSSHAYILARLAIRHLIRRIIWKGSPEERLAKDADVTLKRLYVRSLVSFVDKGEVVQVHVNPDTSFWGRDDGASELLAITKEL